MAGFQDMSRVVCGPAEVRVAGVPVGRTEGPVRMRLSPILREETAACAGAGPVDFVVVGLRAELSVPLAEYVLENVILAMPHASGAAGYAALGALPGRRLSASAATVTVHPLSRASDDPSEDLTLHRAVCVGTVELEYSAGADRLLEARFVGLADLERADGDLVGRVAAPGRSG